MRLVALKQGRVQKWVLHDYVERALRYHEGSYSVWSERLIITNTDHVDAGLFDWDSVLAECLNAVRMQQNLELAALVVLRESLAYSY